MKPRRALTNFQTLIRFVVRRDVHGAKEFLKQDHGLNAQDLGRALWYAITFDQTEIATAVIKAGADSNLKHPFGRGSTFLHKIVPRRESRYKRLAVLMMERGVNVNAHNDLGKSVLDWAIYSECTPGVARELLKRGAKSSDISVAFKHPNAVEIIQLLVDRDSPGLDKRYERMASIVAQWIDKINVERRHFHRQLAACDRLLAVVKLPVDRLEDRGLTLQSVIKMGKVEMVHMLVKYGFDVNKPAKDGELPLYTASKSTKSAITELLIRAGAKVNSVSENLHRGYALHAACENQSTENVWLLLRHGADVRVVDSLGRTPFSQINFYELIDNVHELVLKHLSTLVSKGKIINDSDLNIIQNHPAMLLYYTRCLSELNKIKRMTIINDVSFLSFLGEDARKLIFVNRHYNFAENINVTRWERQFPIFYEEMKLAYQNAERRKKLLNQKEKTVCDSLKDFLPDLPLEKIVYYVYINDIE